MEGGHTGVRLSGRGDWLGSSDDEAPFREPRLVESGLRDPAPVLLVTRGTCSPEPRGARGRSSARRQRGPLRLASSRAAPAAAPPGEIPFGGRLKLQ